MFLYQNLTLFTLLFLFQSLNCVHTNVPLLRFYRVHTNVPFTKVYVHTYIPLPKPYCVHTNVLPSYFFSLCAAVSLLADVVRPFVSDTGTVACSQI